jgi:hypothetical protein
VSIRKPAHEACQHPPGHVRWRLRPPPMHTVPLRGAVQGHQDGEGPGTSGTRPLDEHRYDHPCMAQTLGGSAVRRPHPIARPSLLEHLRARVLGDRIVASQAHRSRREYMVQQAREHGASQRPG